MNVDVNAVNEAIKDFEVDLNGALEVVSVWVRGSKPIATYGGGNDAGSILFDQISDNIEKALKVVEFPKVDPYYLWKTEAGLIIGAILINNVQAGIVFNLGKTNLGLALNIAIPNFADKLREITQK